MHLLFKMFEMELMKLQVILAL
ncbi:hypothetical protein RCCS2_12104 [Roseobacter sp. CCS2]|nr:hypothetical protein RCCS2_12104 [Roseobacter sp. CCS2]